MAACRPPLAAILSRPTARLMPALRPTPTLTRRTLADTPAQPRPNAQPKSQPKSQPRNKTASAIDNLFGSAPPAARPRTNHIFGADFSAPPTGPRQRKAPGLNFDDMVMPESLGNVVDKPRDAAAALAAQQESFESYPRLNPTYGRTIDLDNSRGRDIVRGIGMLGSLVARNKVKADFNKQRFHERGGLKRKRLNSERWRARFKLGFRHVTARVTELTKKGW